jgi:enoyl-CoA hydratase
MAVASIVVEQHDSVRRIVLNRPEKLNATDRLMLDSFFGAVDDAVADPGTRVVVVSGAGRAFSSGADLKAVPTGPTPGAGLGGDGSVGNAPVDMVLNRERVERWLRLRSIPKPLIAQVHGYCLGSAMEIAGCCDLVICGQGAQFGMPEVREFALPPTLGFLPLRIGSARTKELLWTGRLVDGREATTLGLVDAVVPDADLSAHVLELAGQIAEIPPARLAVVKQAVNSWTEAFGVRDAAMRGADYHALYHQVSTYAARLEKRC